MKVYNTIQKDRTLYVFTDNPEKDIIVFIGKYHGESKIHLGYEEPRLDTYNFLGNPYKCINLWYDSEMDMADSARDYFDSTPTDPV